MEKQCTKCKTSKAFEEFNRDKSRKDGYFPQCRECCKRYLQDNKKAISEKKRLWHQNNNESILKRMKKYRIENREKILARMKVYSQTEKGKEIARLNTTKYNRNNPDKKKARDAVNTAIQSRRIPSVNSFMCSICNKKQAEEYHHHQGYEKEHQLDVIPVCKECHIIIENS